MIRRVACGLAFLSSMALCSCKGAEKGDGSAGGDATAYASNGARIYYTATSQSGSPVLSANRFGDTPRPALRSCVDCHGADGAGGVIETDSGTIRTPVIQYAHLSATGTYAGGRAYDEASLALTLRTGVRVDGYLLSPSMPRWTLSPEDMKDLIAHLKTLGPHTGTR